MLVDLQAYVALALHDGGGPHERAHRPRDAALTPDHFAQIRLGDPQSHDRGIAVFTDRTDLNALRLIHEIVGEELNQTNHMLTSKPSRFALPYQLPTLTSPLSSLSSLSSLSLVPPRFRTSARAAAVYHCAVGASGPTRWAGRQPGASASHDPGPH